jgi:glutamate formiminotransferase
MLLPVAYETYKMFAKRYGIRIHNKEIINDKSKYTKKTMKQLSEEIKHFEKTNKISNGLYYI